LSGGRRMSEKSSPFAFQCSTAGCTSSSSTRPTISSIVRKPSSAMCSRSSWATKRKKRTTYSTAPSKRARRIGSCVATPTGQVFRWHFRIMMHPRVTSTAVPNPNSSAPISAAMARSRPVFNCPSTCTRIRSRSRL
jgi:hypothetical protein